MSSISFRPHHFLCALCFQGAGYSSGFVRNFKTIMRTLNTDESTLIHIVSHTDSICAPCPHRTDLLCNSQQKINQLDQAHAEALDIKSNTTISWKDAKQQIKNHLTLEKFHQICEPCDWKKFGICEKILTEFLVEDFTPPANTQSKS